MQKSWLSTVPVISGLMRGRFFKSYFALILSFLLGSTLTYLLCNSTNTIIVAEKPDQIVTRVEDVQSLPEGNENFQSQDRGVNAKNEIIRELITTKAPMTTQLTTVRQAPTEARYPPLVTGEGKILTPPNVCDGTEFLLILVVTSSRNFAARKSIRSSWAKRFASTASEKYKVIFVLGCDNENDNRVEKEAKRYKDIIRGNYLDSFRQNEYHSVKSLLGLKWANTACASKYVMLAYHDTFVNVVEAIKWMQSLGDGQAQEAAYRQGLYAGFCHGIARGGARVVRNPKSQWYIAKEEYPDDTLPPYASGAAIVLSTDVVTKILKLSKKVGFQ